MLCFFPYFNKKIKLIITTFLKRIVPKKKQCSRTFYDPEAPPPTPVHGSKNKQKAVTFGLKYALDCIIWSIICLWSI